MRSHEMRDWGRLSRLSDSTSTACYAEFLGLRCDYGLSAQSIPLLKSGLFIYAG